MVLYAVGHSVLLVGTGIGYSYVDRAIKNPRYAAAGVWLRRILGVVILAFWYSVDLCRKIADYYCI